MVSLRDQFMYHPPRTEERKARHNAVNDAALAFALVINEHVTDETFRAKAIDQIQLARMFANQGITFAELQPTLVELPEGKLGCSCGGKGFAQVDSEISRCVVCNTTYSDPRLRER